MKIKNLRVKPAEIKTEKIKITTDFIRLDSALKLANIAGTGGIAKIIITQGDIKVNGEVCTQRGKKLRKGDTFLFRNTAYEIE